MSSRPRGHHHRNKDEMAVERNYRQSFDSFRSSLNKDYSVRELLMGGIPEAEDMQCAKTATSRLSTSLQATVANTDEGIPERNGADDNSQPPAAPDASNEDDKDAKISELKAQVQSLKAHIEFIEDADAPYFASDHAQLPFLSACDMPAKGQHASHVLERLRQIEQLDHKPRLNTSSYVNVVMEPEEEQAALLGLTTNLADGSVYPASIMVHDNVVNMLARLWNAPDPPHEEYVHHVRRDKYCGAGTVGSTEACLLSGLALKFRWRRWYAERYNLTDEEVLGVRPNLVISTAYQAAWEKFFRFFDVEPRLVKPSVKSKFAVDAREIVKLCDEKTICVVGILGNHYNGSYDPIWDMDEEVRALNSEKGYQIGIHVDAASGAFIAPFQVDKDGNSPPPFDFRLESVLSFSASGHKFGESICGTGWVVFRQREDLADHIAISVSYLGGKCDSITLNFSRPASACYVQAYKLLRLGKDGYRRKVANQLKVAEFLRSCLRDMRHPNGDPRFQIMDGEDDFCLPVVAARLNPDHPVMYNDIDLQHALESNHWYVSGYGLTFEDPVTQRKDTILSDVEHGHTMFRIVVKCNLTMSLACDLANHLARILPRLDRMNSLDDKHIVDVVRKSLWRGGRAGLGTESTNSSQASDLDTLAFKAC